MTLQQFLDLRQPGPSLYSYTNKLDQNSVLITVETFIPNPSKYIIWDLRLEAPIGICTKSNNQIFVTDNYDYDHWKQILSTFNKAGTNGERLAWDEIMELYGFNEEQNGD